MKTIRAVPFLAALAFGFPLSPAMAQHDHGAMADMAGTGMNGMAMPDKILLLAQLDGQQVVPPTDSKATATGAFQLDPKKGTLDYRLTYQGLEGGVPQQIALYNFGRGGATPKVLAVLCTGSGRGGCPQQEAGTISGQLGKKGELTINNALVGEFASERVYVEIVTSVGDAEIRGQLAANDLMTEVENYVVELAPMNGGGAANGTAVVTKAYLPDGKVAVTYAATVAGLADAPKAVSITRDRYQRGKDADLLKTKIRRGRGGQNGSTLDGTYEVDGSAAAGVKDLKPADASKRPGLVIKTNQSPDGAVYGALIPVE
jgi:hypothetical protein